MRVHLFGAASSPGCADYSLKHIAAQGRGHFSEATIRFIERNFYMDDGLISVSTDEETIELMNEARQLRIHKFISNRQGVLASLPREECVETARHQDLALSEPQIERALGVKWCVSSDQFLLRVAWSLLFHARAPFMLVGKQILQQMCRDKTGWDELLSDDLW